MTEKIEKCDSMSEDSFRSDKEQSDEESEDLDDMA